MSKDDAIMPDAAEEGPGVPLSAQFRLPAPGAETRRQVRGVRSLPGGG